MIKQKSPGLALACAFIYLQPWYNSLYTYTLFDTTDTVYLITLNTTPAPESSDSTVPKCDVFEAAWRVSDQKKIKIDKYLASTYIVHLVSTPQYLFLGIFITIIIIIIIIILFQVYYII